ncbi:MAG: amidohydrolase family protein [Deltaproteobacteria bacterium]|nr:amidohydrolase family protein [Deltaproteobacteria bacterium]
MSDKAAILPENMVDFHVHLFPDRLFDAIWKRFIADYGWDVIHRLYWREAVDYLREKGVKYVVYSNYAHKKGVADALNAFNREVLDNSENVFCFCAFHPDDDGGLEKIASMMDHKKVMGVKLQLLVQNFYPHDERLFPLYELVMEKNKRILFHVGTGPVGNPFVGAAHFEKVLNRYPEIPANIAHMGGLEYGVFMDFLESHKSLVMDTSFSFLPGISYDQGPERLLKNRERIVYGSDFPNLIMPRKTEIENLKALGLPQDFYDRVFRDNGLRILGQCCPDGFCA